LRQLLVGGGSEVGLAELDGSGEHFVEKAEREKWKVEKGAVDFIDWI
jgi:hypothetical protein